LDAGGPVDPIEFVAAEAYNSGTKP